MTDKTRKNVSVPIAIHKEYKDLAHVRETDIAKLLREGLDLLKKKYATKK